MKTCFHCFSFS